MCSFIHNIYHINLKSALLDPGWYGSAGWVSSQKLRSLRLGSQSGHMPGLQARSPAGAVQEAADIFFLAHQCLFPSLNAPLNLISAKERFKERLRKKYRMKVVWILATWNTDP